MLITSVFSHIIFVFAEPEQQQQLPEHLKAARMLSSVAGILRRWFLLLPLLLTLLCVGCLHNCCALLAVAAAFRR